jgi:hypothetical protein
VSPVETILETCPELSDTQAEAIVAALYPRLVNALVVAETFNLSRDWVYDNAGRLGARVLGSGKYARKRFVLAEVRDRLAAMTGEEGVTAHVQDEEAAELEHREPRKSRARMREGLTPTGNPLLPLPEAA